MSQAGVWTPLRERNFRLLVAARTVDYIGNGIAPVALAFAVLDLTGSTTDLGLVVGARSIANVVLLLFGGVLADRFPRALVLQGSALLAAVSQAIVAVSVLGGFGSVALLAILGIVNGAGAAGSLPAAAALLPQTVPGHLLRQANALARIGIATAMIVGSAVGGVLVASIGPGWGLAIDAATFAASAACFARVRVRQATSAVPITKPLKQLWDGWTEFTARSWVWTVVLQFLVVNAVVAASVQVLGPAVADHTIGRTNWGLVLAAQAVGTLLGGVFAAYWQPRYALFFGVALGGVELLPILALAHLPEAAVLVIAMFLSGLAIEQFSVAWEVSLQQHIAADALARVYSYDALGSLAAVPIGQLIVGPLAHVVGVPATLDGAAGALMVATAASLAVPSVRRLTTQRVEPAPGPPTQEHHRGAAREKPPGTSRA
jgi:MFS family permease